jgi:predicted HTH transcriptional regulator
LIIGIIYQTGLIEELRTGIERVADSLRNEKILKPRFKKKFFRCSRNTKGKKIFIKL